MELTEEIMKRGEAMGYHLTDKRLRIAIPEARLRMWEMMQRLCPAGAVWHPEYDAIAQWLTDNGGRGLIFMGTPGMGKSMMCERIIPTLVGYFHGLWFRSFRAVELNTRYEEISRNRLISIDDIGTEAAETKDWGTRHSYFNELLDIAEHEDKTLLLSTNLTWTELQRRYGLRTDRLRSLVLPIAITGESHRSGRTPASQQNQQL